MSNPSSPAIAALLRATPPRVTLDWAAQRIGRAARIVAVEPLLGGQSHANHVLRAVTQDGCEVEVVLRRWVRENWRELDPQFSPDQEAATFGLLAAWNVSAPRLIAADPSGAECDVPAIIVTRAVGGPMADPRDRDSFVRQLAEALLPIHAIDPEAAARTVPAYRPYYRRHEIAVPAWAGSSQTWERAIEIATGEPPAREWRFIHRDYHPGNTLWVEDRLTAIVDWTTASFGAPSVDLSHMRVNLAMSFDLDLADAFLLAHESVSGGKAWHPYWDLRVAADLLPDLPQHTTADPRLLRLETFVERAVAAVL